MHVLETPRDQLTMDVRPASGEDGVVLIEAWSGRILACNQAAARLLERDASDLCGLTILDLLPGRSGLPVGASYKETFSLDPGVERLEVSLVRGSGDPLVVEMTLDHVRGSGMRDQVVCQFRPIEREQREADAIMSEVRKWFFSVAQISVFSFDWTGKFLYYNGEVIRPTSEALWRQYSVFTKYRNQPVVLRALNKALMGEEMRIVYPDGEGVFELWLSPFKDNLGQVDRVVGMLQDVTMHQRAEEQLARVQRHHALILDAAADGIVSVDTAGWIASANPMAGKLLGYAPASLVGKSFGIVLRDPAAARDLIPDDSDAMGTPIALQFRHRDGTGIPVECLSSPLFDRGEFRGAVIVFRDVRDRIHRQHEVQFRHSQKLEAVGRLAAGIAHEINTPIQFVGDTISFLEEGFFTLDKLLRGGVGDAESTDELNYLEDRIPPALDRAQRGLRRVSEIVRAMKDFAYPDRTERLAADLNKAIRDTVTVAFNELKYVAEVELDLGLIPPVHCFVGDLNQAILNLLINAAQAIKAAAGTSALAYGRIGIRTFQEGEGVVIAISDSGCGIPDAIADKVFDPFFTTKDVGQGTGQGLAIARSVVVEKHGGTIDFSSAPGRGTTFVIRLPIGSPEA